MGILTKIINHKIKEIEQRKKERPLKSFIDKIDQGKRNFKEVITSSDSQAIPNLIAEIKKASPSAGLLRPSLENDLEEIVKIYNQHATAISIVTDQKFFQGDLEWIKKIRKLTKLPILCKDFIVDEYQIYEARLYGADAVLLIYHETCNMKHETTAHLIKTARQLNMGCLVEARSQEEIKNALNAGAKIIGINNRNLETFEVNIDNSLDLVKYIPDDIIKVNESGFKTADNIKKAAGYVDAVLIGTRFMQEDNIEDAMAQLGFLPSPRL
jgi:indole-3-glycerol phosphate synthase/phosphoribosylanthranilate isomerase